MNATIVWIAEKIAHPVNTTIACAGVASSIGLWAYHKLITDPLRTFYFVGAYWRNAPKPEICFRLTNVDSSWWSSTSDRMDQCIALTEREFESFDATLMTTLYFTVLTFVILHLFCNCCVVNPIVRAIRREERAGK